MKKRSISSCCLPEAIRARSITSWRKLILSSGTTRRAREQVRDLVPLSRAGVIFELSNALIARDLDRALALVRRLLDQGESAMGLLLVAVLPTCGICFSPKI